MHDMTYLVGCWHLCSGTKRSFFFPSHFFSSPLPPFSPHPDSFPAPHLSSSSLLLHLLSSLLLAPPLSLPPLQISLFSRKMLDFMSSEDSGHYMFYTLFYYYQIPLTSERDDHTHFFVFFSFHVSQPLTSKRRTLAMFQ